MLRIHVASTPELADSFPVHADLKVLSYTVDHIVGSLTVGTHERTQNYTLQRPLTG